VGWAVCGRGGGWPGAYPVPHSVTQKHLGKGRFRATLLLYHTRLDLLNKVTIIHSASDKMRYNLIHTGKEITAVFGGFPRAK